MDELMRTLLEPGTHLFHGFDPARMLYESVEGGGEGGGGGEVGGEQLGGETGGESGGEEVVGPEAAAAIEALSREEIIELAREGAGGAFSEILQRAAAEEAAQRQRAEQARGAELPEWDPFNPEVVRAYQLENMRPILERLEQVIGPAIESSESYRMEQGRQAAVSMLTGLEETVGPFDHDRAIVMAARYQAQGLDSEQAIQRAASEQAQFEKGIAEKAVEAFRTNAQNMGNASLEGGVTGAAADVEQQPLTKAGERIDYREAARRTIRLAAGGAGVASPTG